MIFLISKGQKIFFIHLETSHAKQTKSRVWREQQRWSRFLSRAVVSVSQCHQWHPEQAPSSSPTGTRSAPPPSATSSCSWRRDKRSPSEKARWYKSRDILPFPKWHFLNGEKKLLWTLRRDSETCISEEQGWKSKIRKGKSLGSGRAWGLSRRKSCCQDLVATFTGKSRTKHAAKIKWICSQGSMLRFICFICTEIRVGCCPSQTAPQPIPLQSRRKAGWQLILHGLFHWLLTWTECTFSAVAFGQHWESNHELDLQKCACWVSSWMMEEPPPQLAMDRENMHFSYANHVHIFLIKEWKIGLHLVFLWNHHSVWNLWIINNIIRQI